MIRKFATVPGFRVALAAIFLAAILAGSTTVRAQQTPAQTPPAKPQPDTSSSQEASPDDATSTRKVKPREYKNWTFNVGGGGSLTNGVTTKYVKGGGGIAEAGVARNYSKYFAFRLDFQWDNLPLRNSALELAQAPSATSQVYTVTLDPQINIPANKDWSGYVLGGPGFFHRFGKLDSSTAIPGSACNAFWNWWGTCFNGAIPLNNRFLKTDQNEFGANFGFGVARKITPTIELYGEFRYLHGSGNGRTTDLRPITIGLRF